MICHMWLIQVPGDARSALSQKLHEDGFHVDEFDGVEQALQHLGQAHPPRLIFLCLVTGAQAGARLARGLASKEDWAGVPVLGLTTLAQPSAPLLEPWVGAARMLCGEG